MIFGWSDPFGSFGGSGGIRLPAAIADLDQWIYKTLEDGTFSDKVSPQKVDPVPAVKDGYCGTFGGSDKATFQAGAIAFPVKATGWIYINPTANYETIFAWSDNTATTQFLAINKDTSNRIALQLNDGTGAVTPTGSTALSGRHYLDVLITESDFLIKVDGNTEIDTGNSKGAPSVNVFTFGCISRTTDIQFFSGRIAQLQTSHAGRVPIVISAGQSNARSSKGGTTGMTPGVYADQPDHRFWYYVDDGLDPAYEGQDEDLRVFDDLRIGPEAALGYNITQNAGENVVVVKTAIGGTSVHGQWLPTGFATNTLIGLLQDAMDSVRASGGEPYIKDIMWTQGESDCELGRSDDYAARWRETMNRIAGAAGVSFDDVHITISQTAETYPSPDGQFYTDELRAQQQLLADTYSNVDIFDVDGIEISGDGIHYTGVGQEENGNRFYEVYETLVSDTSDVVVVDCALQTGDGNIAESQGTYGDGIITATPAAFWANRQDVDFFAHLNGYSNAYDFDGATNAKATVVASGSYERIVVAFYTATEVDDTSAFQMLVGDEDNIAYYLSLGDTAGGKPDTMYLSTKYGFAYIEDVIGIGWHVAEFDWVNGQYVITMDGKARVTTNTCTSPADDWKPVVASRASNNGYFTGKIALVRFGTSSKYVFNEKTGSTIADALGSIDLTLSSATGWGDRTLNQISDMPNVQGCAGTTLIGNGSEVTYKIADSVAFDVFGTDTGGSKETIFGNGVDTWYKVTWADLEAHISGHMKFYLRWISINGICHLDDWGQYSLAWVTTVAELQKNTLFWKQGTCGAGIVVPFMVDDGMGGETPWLDINSKSLLLLPS